jgi:hypothetical protein
MDGRVKPGHHGKGSCYFFLSSFPGLPKAEPGNPFIEQAVRWMPGLGCAAPGMTNEA